MSTTNTKEKSFQGEAIENASESENLQTDQLVSNSIKMESELPSVSGRVNLSIRQRSIIGSCFGEDFLL